MIKYRTLSVLALHIRSFVVVSGKFRRRCRRWSISCRFWTLKVCLLFVFNNEYKHRSLARGTCVCIFNAFIFISVEAFNTNEYGASAQWYFAPFPVVGFWFSISTLSNWFGSSLNLERWFEFGGRIVAHNSQFASFLSIVSLFPIPIKLANPVILIIFSI